MKIKIIFDIEKVKTFMLKNNFNEPQLSYNWGISIKYVRQILTDGIYLDSQYISEIKLENSLNEE